MMLPEALNTTEYGSKVGIAIKDLNLIIVLAGLALDPEVAKRDPLHHRPFSPGQALF